MITTQESTATSTRVAVIGAGLGGLAAACTLAARGKDVILFDKNDWLGGKAAVLVDQGFRFDMGPTILTVPKVLERIFGEAGRNLHEEMDLRRLDPQWRCFFEDGSVLDLNENVETMAKTLAEYSPNTKSSEGYRQLINISKKLHEVSDRFFFWKTVEGLTDTFDMSNTFNLSTLKDVMSLRMGKSVAGVIRQHVPDTRVAQMLDHFTQYVGSSPYNSPAVLVSIAHMQTDGGVWYPIGGTRAVPTALESLARQLGVEIRPSTTITRIETQGSRVKAVVTHQGETIDAGAIVSNMDTVRTHRELLGQEGNAFLHRRNYEPACSGVVLYLGLREAYDHVAHHDFVFSRDPEEEFDAIYHKGIPAPDPTAYLACPSKTEPDVAPQFDGKQGEALYVLVHTPYLRPDHDWKKMLPEYRQVILDKLKRTAGMEDIEERIVCEHALTPQDIHERYHVLNGAIYGLASHGKFLGAFKPGNRSRDIDGLYLAGGSAHPGPGMPMALMSGWIAADTLCKDGIV